MHRVGSWSLDDLDSASMKHPSRSPGLEIAMALFGMVWLLRVRSEMRRCSKCRHEEIDPCGPAAATATAATADAAAATAATAAPSSPPSASSATHALASNQSAADA